jgi:hypothetical protein
MMEKNTYKGASQFLFFSYCFSAMDVTAIPTRHAECTVLIIHNTCFFEDEGGRRRAESSANVKFFFSFYLHLGAPNDFVVFCHFLYPLESSQNFHLK